MTQVILDDLHLLVDQTRIWRKICDSIRFHASNRLWFSERPFNFALTAGRASYAPGDGFGLPADLVEIVGRKLYLWYGGSESSSQSVEWLSSDEFDCRKEWDTTTGTPDGWTYDGRRLKLVPTPNSSTDILTGDYVTNIGVPKFRYNGSSYDFFTPDGAALSADYTSDWFQWDTAEQLIRFRVMYELLKTLKDPEADTYLGSWLEAKTRLEDETDAKVAGGMDSLVPRLL